jgi:predicted small secreted protein
MRKTTPIIVVFVMAALTLCGCQGNGAAGPAHDNHAAVKVDILKSSLVEQITRVVLQVVIMDEIVHADTTSVVNGTFSFDPFELPVGEAYFGVYASDASDRVLYQGSASADIISGIENEISVILLPAVPMVKLTPYYQSVGVGQQFTTTIELFNVQRFFNGSFKIAYNPDLFTYEDIAQQADPAWGDLIIFARDAGDTVVVSVSRTQGTSDVVSPSLFSLLNLQFRTIQQTSAELRLVVDVLDDFDGPVIELPALYVDHETVVVTGAENQ